DEETASLLKEAMVSTGDSAAIVGALKAGIGNVSIFAEALGEVMDPSTVSELESLLDRVDREVRKVLLRGLEKIGSASSFDSLVKALNDADGHVRGLAARAVVATGDTRGVGVLRDALVKEPFSDVREVIGAALSSCRGGGVEGVFEDLLQSENPSLRTVAVKGFGRLKTAGAMAFLKEAAADKDPDVRKEAVLALGLFDEDDAVGAIVSGALADDKREVKMAALQVAGAMGDGEKILIEAVGNSDMWVRFKAVSILGEKRAAAAEDAIIGLLLGDEPPVKIACIKALGNMRSARAVGVLKGFIDHADPYIREAARNAVKGSL
ncbi:MAG: HEAT repeat domain-containing protein, partial [Deltaproteobacteria bacterium]|nr:HEAT repeat domain-containing protein [Deltaproteobacteria bacterium]